MHVEASRGALLAIPLIFLLFPVVGGGGVLVFACVFSPLDTNLSGLLLRTLVVGR